MTQHFREDVIAAIELLAAQQIQSLFFENGEAEHPSSLLWRPGTNARKRTIFFRVLTIIHELLLSNMQTTKRDLFYMDPTLFRTQQTSNAAIEEVARILNVPRASLNVFGSAKGIVAGNLSFVENGVQVNCTSTATLINPQSVHESFESTAAFMLIVEKDAIFQHLLESGFCDAQNALLVTGKGYPDLKTRLFVHAIASALPLLPVLLLVDADPYGIDIACNYAFGSAKRHCDERVEIPRLQLIGLRPTDLSTLPIAASTRLPLTQRDINKLASLKRQFETQLESTDWIQEIEWMEQQRAKAELECLSSISHDYLVNVYLQGKLDKYLRGVDDETQLSHDSDFAETLQEESQPLFN
ncbi:putative Meiotic recombination protein SPO11 [Blattamonas nauphoetae]|uniref:DNA topoisomerase (ATP-hydrolyzing) n=1 Tax=Blattamonas nauphoetae TaxID=2049346 RepID=A0ABQ9YM78_9EUKA|nr:putative Meiotic recombination protein SPO11 [Blattamonas nauphoetae]